MKKEYWKFFLISSFCLIFINCVATKIFLSFWGYKELIFLNHFLYAIAIVSGIGIGYVFTIAYYEEE